MKTDIPFEEAYKRLNKAQKEAVDTIDGPVMVIAGPGTGKTDVLAVRIAHILKKTDTPANGILCLTFTNAGVTAMRERVARYIGADAGKISIFTFHSFALRLIEKHYELLDFDQAPVLLDEMQSVVLIDSILEDGEWDHLRPRGNSSKYFSDLKSLVSLMKRERLTPEKFSKEIVSEIKKLKDDPANISSRGATKGELKKEIQKKIEGLERTKEVVVFYEVYEKEKHDRGLIDYDDALALSVRLVEISEDVRATLREEYLYVLVDEHQDSSGVQNAFLEAVWGETEKPNLFVVGDDRQLIYGFGGASLAQFNNFKTSFGKAHEIILIENYRSTQAILDSAGTLLESALAQEKLHANSNNENQKPVLFECDYPRDEILIAARAIKDKIEEGTAPDECAILVPKNYQARSAMEILRDQGLPVATGDALSFFTAPETTTIRTILKIITDPYDAVALGRSLFDPVLGIPPMMAHQFLHGVDSRKLSVELLSEAGTTGGLFPETDPIVLLGKKLKQWLARSSELDLKRLIQMIGEELFLTEVPDQATLVRRVEVIRTFLHLALSAEERDPHLTLISFLAHLDRLESYGHTIPLAVFGGKEGIRVLTFHGSKGLEFSYVHIAHLDESSLMKGKRLNFTLPEKIEELVESKDEAVARRELYVAMTRAKETLSLSYARRGYTGGTLQPATIMLSIPEDLVIRKNISDTEEMLLGKDPRDIVTTQKESPKLSLRAELIEIVKKEYPKTKVSVTLLNNFFECPWKWYFRNLLKLPESKTESLVFGSMVHAGIEYMLGNKDDSVSEEMLVPVLLRILAHEGIRDGVSQKRMIREATKTLAIWQKIYAPTILLEYATERSIQMIDPDFPHLRLYGKIDLTERLSPDEVMVTDFKTGSSKTKSTIEKRDDEERLSSFIRQLAMYSYLISGAEKGTTVTSSKLLFVEEDPKEKDTVYSTTIGDEEIELLRHDIADYDQSLKEGSWVERPCYFKSYGKETECSYCALAKRINF